jgi:hypothetical protein
MNKSQIWYVMQSLNYDPFFEALRSLPYDIRMLPHSSLLSELTRVGGAPQVIVTEYDKRLMPHCHSEGYHPNALCLTARPFDDVVPVLIREGWPQGISRKEEPAKLLRKVVNMTQKQGPSRTSVLSITGPNYFGKSSVIHELFYDRRAGPFPYPFDNGKFVVLPVSSNRDPKANEIATDSVTQWVTDTSVEPDFSIPADPIIQSEMKELRQHGHLLWWKGANEKDYLTEITYQGQLYAVKNLGVSKNTPCLEELLDQKKTILWATANVYAAHSFFECVHFFNEIHKMRDEYFNLPHTWHILSTPQKNLIDRFCAREGLSDESRSIIEQYEDYFFTGSPRTSDVTGDDIITIGHRQKNLSNPGPLLADDSSLTETGLRLKSLLVKYAQFNIARKVYRGNYKETDMSNFFDGKDEIYESAVAMWRSVRSSGPRRALGA